MTIECLSDKNKYQLNRNYIYQLKKKRVFPQENQVLKFVDFCGNILIVP